jgi:hypothetical protein
LSDSEQESLRAFTSKDNEKTAIGFHPWVDSLTWANLTTSSALGSARLLELEILCNKLLFPELIHNKARFALEKEHSKSFLYKTGKYAHQVVGKSDHDVYAEGDVTTDRTSSTASLQMASAWLRDCFQSHSQCNTNKGGNSWYPTRLLHLIETNGNEGYIWLIRTAEKPPDGPYATLSHCWGNARPLQLTHSMASDPDHWFSVAAMPKTFREAIQVCIRLGIRYLWIDSLCIIQEGDDLRDWYHEASLMDKVYIHSYLNIAAADAADSTKGLFRYRHPILLGRQRVTVNTEGIKLDPACTDYLMEHRPLWGDILETSPLHKRGWVLQERFLAPRVLHFCRNQLFWECKAHLACETFPKGLPNMNTKRSYARDTYFSGLDIGICLSADASMERWTYVWKKCIVEVYSGMKLTVPTDKLIALSGIAKYFMARLKDTYVAGMWRRQLEHSLLWLVDPQCRKPRPLLYRSPTWSWTSVDGKIQTNPFQTDRELLINVEDVVLSYATEDTTGAITSGWMDLRGFLKPTGLIGDKELDTVWRMNLDYTTASQQHGVVEEIVLFDILPDKNWIRNDDNTQEHFFFMPCRLSGETADCLLFRLVDKEKNLFERIGYVWVRESVQVEKILAELDEDTRARLPCLRYENGQHTIRII